MLTSATRQLLFDWLMPMADMLWFEGAPHEWPLPSHVPAWIGYNGVTGIGTTYLLGFVAVERLPAVTASLDVLLVLVVGVLDLAWLVGKRPNVAGITGFALIFTVAAFVLLQPNLRHDELPK